MNQYVIDGLKTKIAELNLRLRESERLVRKLHGDRSAVLAALRVFEGPDILPPIERAKRGSFARSIYDVLRDAGEPISPRGIAEWLAAKSGKPVGQAEVEQLLKRVRASLPKLSDKLAYETRDGDQAVYWAIKKEP